MITIRAIVIIMIVSSLVYNNGRAMEMDKAKNLPSIDHVPILFFLVNNQNDLQKSTRSFKDDVTGSIFYMQCIPMCTTIAPADMEKNFMATTKINCHILADLGYCKDDRKKYAIRAAEVFNQRVPATLQIKNLPMQS